MKIKKGDLVKVITGKDKGKKGKIEKVFPKKGKVLVAGVNLFKRHLKPQGEKKPGGIVEISKPLARANVVLICPKCQQSTRVGFLLDKGKAKHRMCKKCQKIID